MSVSATYRKNIEKKVGLSIQEIRNSFMHELMAQTEKRNGKEITVKSYFPLVGRGNVNRKLISHKQVEKIVDSFFKFMKIK